MNYQRRALPVLRAGIFNPEIGTAKTWRVEDPVAGIRYLTEDDFNREYEPIAPTGAEGAEKC
jgi:hypothetical protein